MCGSRPAADDDVILGILGLGERSMRSPAPTKKKINKYSKLKTPRPTTAPPKKPFSSQISLSCIGLPCGLSSLRPALLPADRNCPQDLLPFMCCSFSLLARLPVLSGRKKRKPEFPCPCLCDCFRPPAYRFATHSIPSSVGSVVCASVVCHARRVPEFWAVPPRRNGDWWGATIDPCKQSRRTGRCNVTRTACRGRD